jgi:hypothetical protein
MSAVLSSDSIIEACFKASYKRFESYKINSANTMHFLMWYPCNFTTANASSSNFGCCSRTGVPDIDEREGCVFKVFVDM